MNMRQFLMIAVAATVIAVGAACSVQAVEIHDIPDVVEGNTDFAFELYHELSGISDGENFFFSPYSISIALAMTYAGARAETAEAMADTMHYILPQESLHPAFRALDDAITSREGLELYTANSLWGQTGYTFLQEFLDLLEESYGAGMNLANFLSDPESARITINEWIYEETRGKIADLIPPGGVSRDTLLVLVNAIYFKANWLAMFDPDRTRSGRFTLLDGERVDCEMMHMNAEFPFFWTEDYSAIELPYSGEDLSMVIILPELEKFRDVERLLDPEMVDEITDRMYLAELPLAMPKFEMTSLFSLADVLSTMGMSVAFADADFSGMDGTRDLFISGVFHKAYILVHEEGTEATAATAEVLADEGMPGGPAFIATHPFIFFIRDRETGAILFMGRMMDPSTAQVSESSESD